MKKLAIIITALVLAQASTFAAISINLDAKKSVIEVQSTESVITDITLNKVDGGEYIPQIITPNYNMNITAKSLQKGVYMVNVQTIKGEKEVQFLNIN